MHWWTRWAPAATSTAWRSRKPCARARDDVFADEIEAGRLTVSPGDLCALPLAEASLDAAITTNTIYVVEDLPRAFAEVARVARVARVVRPGGRVVVGIGDPDKMRNMPFTAHGFRLRPVDEVAGLLEAAGFGVPEDPPRG